MKLRNSMANMQAFAPAYTIDQKSFKGGIGYAWNIEDAEMYQTVTEHIGKFKHVAESPLGEVKDMTDTIDIANIQKKIERGVTKSVAKSGIIS